MRERRASQRYGLELAIAFCGVSGLSENENLLGHTRNISTGGMYFTTAQPLALNEEFDFSLTFPGPAYGANVLVTGRARVVRVVQDPETASEPAGIAAITEEYHIGEPEALA